MRYFHSRMWSGWGENRRPHSWQETELLSERKVIKNFYDRYCVVCDADICGGDTIYFAFSTGKFFELDYDWWIERDPEFEVMNEYTIREISEAEAKDIAKDRDWIIV